MEQRRDARSRTRCWWVFALGGLALVTLVNGVSALLLGAVVDLPAGDGRDARRSCEHGDTSPRGHDGEEHEHWQLERKEDGR